MLQRHLMKKVHGFSRLKVDSSCCLRKLKSTVLVCETVVVELMSIFAKTLLTL